ncbi:MAG: hypothetical protein ACRENE_06665 [Polyangiaceae bacterium]
MRSRGVECPACGGCGGGPFGKPGSPWDVEAYVCPRCEGLGVLREVVIDAAPANPLVRPLAKGRANGKVPAKKAHKGA